MLPKNALVKAKKAVEGLMNLKCDIYEYSEITEDSITRHKRQIVHSNVPCRISYATGLFNGKLKSGQEKNSDGRYTYIYTNPDSYNPWHRYTTGPTW